jgi:hypothetical protein
VRSNLGHRPLPSAYRAIPSPCPDETRRIAANSAPSCRRCCGGERFAGIECRLLFLTADDRSESAYTSGRQIFQPDGRTASSSGLVKRTWGQKRTGRVLIRRANTQKTHSTQKMAVNSWRAVCGLARAYAQAPAALAALTPTYQLGKNDVLIAAIVDDPRIGRRRENGQKVMAVISA